MPQNSKTKENNSFADRKIILMLVDGLILLIAELMILVFHPSTVVAMDAKNIYAHILLSAVCVYGFRGLFRAYSQVLRYGGAKAFIRLIISDVLAGMVYYLAILYLPIAGVTFIRALSVIVLNLLGCISIRLLYQYAYELSYLDQNRNESLKKILSLLARLNIIADTPKTGKPDDSRKTRIAIVGATHVGAMLAEEMLSNRLSSYVPCLFIDVDTAKVNREIFGIPVVNEAWVTAEYLSRLSIREVVFAIPNMDPDRRKILYFFYQSTGCKVKVYDYPTLQSAERGKRTLREFDVDDLLFRKQVDFLDEKALAYYQGKTVLITGGGGSIGSELCRQIAKMNPKQLIILDVYENCAYDIQQELFLAYRDTLNFAVEIATICDLKEMENIFMRYHPDVVLHAAAHKHVPLLEHNCAEAVLNNVFGTLNVVNCCEKYGVQKAVMVSTDKAVNPTNVMGATKRMCEMIFQSRVDSKTSFSCTRFGNVLGSNGSVIPLFKRQIANGGPITITDKRIIRYFMTIPEASQLVLSSGAIAKHGDLFVLDMGKPVKILELAENMVYLSGLVPYQDIDIIETGLRPGEKLFEELLIRTEELDKTENSMIFIERDTPLSRGEIEEKLKILRAAVDTMDEEKIYQALRQVVPTFLPPNQVNARAEEAMEMQSVKEYKSIAG